MIDEELYQKAADELNSEHRRPHIWARACALANDDHDEARYLYTNLRVEELLVEATSGASERPVADPMLDGALELEPLEFDELPEPDAGRVSSVTAGSDTVTTPLPETPFGAPDDGTDRPESVLGHTTLEIDGDATLDLDPEDVRLAGLAADDATPPEGERETNGEAGVDDEGADPRTGAPEPLGPDPADEVSDEGADDGPADGSIDEPAGTSAAPPRDALDELFASVEAAHARGDVEPADVERADGGRGDGPPADGDAFPTGPAPVAPESSGTALEDAHGWADADRFDARDPADDSVVETIDAEEIGVDDTVALDSAPRSPLDDAPPASLDDLDWLDEAYRAERRDLATPAHESPDLEDGSDALTRELRRQADELPGGGPGGIIAHEPLDTLPTRRVGRATGEDGADPPASLVASDDTPAPDLEREPRADDGPYAVAIDEPLELVDDDAGDVEYAVFAAPFPDKPPQTVRQGGCWWALLATLPWLLYRRLIGTAIVYALFAVVTLGGLAVTGLSWYEGGAATPLVTKAATIGFALIAVVGLLVVPFRRANHWREDKLERRGFELVAYVRADHPRRAIELVREAGDRLG